MPSFAFSISRFSKNLLHLLFPFGTEKENKQGAQSTGRSGFGQSVVQPCLIPDAIQIVCSGLAVHGETVSVDSRALAGSLSRA